MGTFRDRPRSCSLRLLGKGTSSASTSLFGRSPCWGCALGLEVREIAVIVGRGEAGTKTEIRRSFRFSREHYEKERGNDGRTRTSQPVRGHIGQG